MLSNLKQVLTVLNTQGLLWPTAMFLMIPLKNHSYFQFRYEITERLIYILVKMLRPQRVNGSNSNNSCSIGLITWILSSIQVTKMVSFERHLEITQRRWTLTARMEIREALQPLLIFYNCRITEVHHYKIFYLIPRIVDCGEIPRLLYVNQQWCIICFINSIVLTKYCLQ